MTMIHTKTHTLKTATRATYEEHYSLINPETGEVENVPTGQVMYQYTHLNSSWVTMVQATPTNTAKTRWLIQAFDDKGRQVLNILHAPSYVIMHILTGCYRAKSTGRRSVGATVLRYANAAKIAARPASKPGCPFDEMDKLAAIANA
jgi:hypothetical protein